VRVYLDLCCLKRPFDSQAHPLVRLETEAVVAILSAPEEQLRFVRSAVHALENAFNPVRSRRDAVSQWLAMGPLDAVEIPELRIRSATLVSLGFSKYDSLHLASAELSHADVFVTVDYPLLSRARRQSSGLTVRVSDPIRLAEEVFDGTIDRKS
jgi:hypothetical protein